MSSGLLLGAQACCTTVWQIFMQQGWTPVCSICHPMDLGFPIARPRLWLLCVPRAHMNGMALHAAQEIMQTTIDLCGSEGPSHLTFEHTLLDDQHQLLQAELDTCRNAPDVHWADVPQEAP